MLYSFTRALMIHGGGTWQSLIGCFHVAGSGDKTKACDECWWGWKSIVFLPFHSTFVILIQSIYITKRPDDLSPSPTLRVGCVLFCKVSSCQHRRRELFLDQCFVDSDLASRWFIDWRETVGPLDVNYWPKLQWPEWAQRREINVFLVGKSKFLMDSRA